MAMCTCGECGRMVSTTADVCPSCGRSLRELRARGYTCGYCTHAAYDSDSPDCEYGESRLCLHFQESDYDDLD